MAQTLESLAATLDADPEFHKLSQQEQDQSFAELAKDIPQSASTAQSVEALPFLPFAGTSVGDLGQSAKAYAGNIGQAIMHPLRTVQGVGNIALGGIEKLIPGQQPQEPYVDAVGQFAQQRYGSFDKLKETWKHDPVGVMADASMLLSGGASAATKIGEISAIPNLIKAGGMTARVATAIDPLVATLNASKFAGRIPARILETSQRGMAAHEINSLIKPANRAFAYGRNPGLAIAQEGIVASSLDDLAAKAATAQDRLGQQIGIVLKNPEIDVNRLNIAKELTPITMAIQKAQAAPRTNANVIKRLENLRDDLLGVTIQPDGTSIATRNLTSVSPQEAFQMKKMIGDLTQWTEKHSEDSLVNAASKQVYAGIRQQIESVAPGLKSLNERYANLLEASNAARNRALVLQRHNQFGASDILAGVAGEMRGGIPGVAIGVLLSQGAKAAMQSPWIRTEMAKWLVRATPTEIDAFFKRIPGLQSEAARVGLLGGIGQQRVVNAQATNQSP